jgi:hypothetical protein
VGTRGQSGVAIVEEILVDGDGAAHCGVCLLRFTTCSRITGIIRQLRDRGWEIVAAPSECRTCQRATNHYQVVGSTPTKRRATVPEQLRRRYLEECDHRDAFTLMRSAKLELDHRTPHLRSSGDEAPVTADEIAQRYQPLSPANNQLKRQACHSCHHDGDRPAFFGIPIWLEGSASRPDNCERCPWAFPERWRAHVGQAASAE